MEPFYNLSCFSIWLALLLTFSAFASTEAHDAFKPDGNITINWDVFAWTADGYVGVVTIYNFQKHRRIRSPGWKLGWVWAKNEVIWRTIGGQTTDQGDCSRYRGSIPSCCKRDPTVVDLLPGTPYSQQIANCCKGGVLESNSASSFLLTVGAAGTTNKTVRIPRNFTFKAPGQSYACGPARIVRPTRFLSQDRRRVTQALMTWKLTCFFRKATRAMLEVF